MEGTNSWSSSLTLSRRLRSRDSHGSQYVSAAVMGRHKDLKKRIRRTKEEMERDTVPSPFRFKIDNTRSLIRHDLRS